MKNLSENTQITAGLPEKTAGSCLFLRLGVLALLLTGALGMAAPMLMPEDLSQWLLTMLAGLLTGFGLMWLLPKKPPFRWGALGVLLLWAAICLLSAGKLRDAAAEPLNRLLSVRGMRLREIVLPFEQTPVSALWLLLPAGGILAAALSLFILYAGAWGLLLLPMVWLFAGQGYLSPDGWLTLFSLGVLLLPLTPLRRTQRRAVWQSAFRIGTLLLVIAVLTRFSGLNDRLEPEEARARLQSAFHRLRYESDIRALPEGDLRAPISDASEKEILLAVEMSEPVSLYLKNAAYTVYGENGWSQPDGEALTQSADLLFWLRKNGFYSESQLYRLAECLDESADPVAVKVRTENACRENRYLPPELCGSETLNADTLLDGTVPSEGREQQFQIQPGLVKHAYELLDALEAKQEKAELTEYLRLEESYRAFVRSGSLTVPEECRRLLDALPELGSEVNTTYEAKQLVREILAERAVYDAKADFPGGGEKLLRELLNGEPANEFQYASAAVLMLRQIGVPARYAEGYLITPEDIAGLSGACSLSLYARSAHGWVEYYENGVGWLPFEVAPPYIGLMEEAAWTRFRVDEDAEPGGEAADMQLPLPQDEHMQEPSEAPEKTDIAPPETEPPAEQQEQRREPSQTEHELPPDPFRANWWWLILPVLLLLAFLFLLLRHGKRIREREKRFSDPALPKAISAMFAYCMALMHASGLAERNQLLNRQTDDIRVWSGGTLSFAEMAALNEEALFSTHPFTEAQRESMKHYTAETLGLFRKKLKWPKRLYQRWFRCMY